MLKRVYTAAAHCQCTPRPCVLLENVPVHVTGLIPPGNPPAGTWTSTPVRYSFPARPEDGRVVVQVLLAKLVVASVVVGEKLTCALGTLINCGWPLTLNVMVELVKFSVTG